MSSQEAIQAVGFTDDGMVGILIHIEVNGEKMAANLAMNPEYAESFAAAVVEAAKQAKEKIDVRNSPNLN